MHDRARRRLSNRAFGLVFTALAFACGPTEGEMSTNPTDVSAEVSERVSTVINVKWNTKKPSIGYVEYGRTKDLGLTTPVSEEPVTSHTQPLIGLKPDTPYYYRVVTWDDDAGQSDVKSVRTGYLPPGLPTLELSVPGGHDQFVIVPALGTERSILIIDPDGEIVWYYRDEETEYEHLRARLSVDGKSVLYNANEMTPDPVADSEVVRVSFDGSERTSIPIPYLAHDFVEHADGTIAALTLEDRDMDGSNVRGNKIVEVDPAGNQKDIWTSWNCFDPVEDPGDEADIGAALGWTFANALDYDPSDQAYYVSLHNFSSIAKVSRTGECEWVLGSTASTIEFDIDADLFHHQHQFHIFSVSQTVDHIVLMDNEGSLTPQESRVLEYKLDHELGIATQVWSYTSDPPVYTWVLGEPVRLRGNDTFINWATAGQMERVTQSGEVTWKLNSRLGAAFGFSDLREDLYKR